MYSQSRADFQNSTLAEVSKYIARLLRAQRVERSESFQLQIISGNLTLIQVFKCVLVASESLV